ncbi:MAG TPA: SAVED domain-containing protein [Thermoanaerobaculia bacterium]|nr:SAVED domain-containing protein [Thermoanaerobaculia bacterium]
MDAVKALLPDAREDRRIVAYSATSAPQIRRQGATATPVDWHGVASGVAQMVIRATDERAGISGDIETYVAGQAPLPAFVHLGFELGAWKGRQVILNRRKDGQWDSVQVARSKGSDTFFEHRGLPLPTAAEATGRVAVFVTTIGMPEAPRSAIRDFLQRHGEDLAGIVEVRTDATKTLDSTNGSGVAQELAEVISEVPGSYPYAGGLAVFVAGPATLAFLVGRAINPNVNRDVLLANYTPGAGYEFAYRLPWQGVGVAGISTEPEAVAARQEVLTHVVSAIDDLRGTLDASDLERLAAAERSKFIERLRGLNVQHEAVGDAFKLFVQKGDLSLGAGLLDALRGVADSDQRGIAQLLVLHEVFHFDQNLQSTNFDDVGRAGFALEEVDFWADVFAIDVLSRWSRRTNETTSKPRDTLLRWLDLTLLGIETFDRSEQGASLTRLAERRLRRYLTWHMQRARAETVRSIGDADALLRDRLIVELAPLTGYLDDRFDKYVERSTADTELFVVIRGQLIRRAAQAAFEPSTFVDSVRSFRGAVIQKQLEFVLGEHSEVLTPWAPKRVSI